MGYGMDCEEWFDDEDLDDDIIDHRYNVMKPIYEINSMLKVGSKMYCPYCRKIIVKKSWQHKFCGTECKDKYWNTEPARKKRADFFRGKR
jgi:hypothetical protein